MHRGDKVHWHIEFIYKEKQYAIKHEKFGLRLYSQSDEELKLSKEVC